MTSELAVRMIPELLSQFENLNNVQKEVNLCYQELTNFILEEAEGSLGTLKKKRKCRKFKDYWDDELSTQWKNMKECERVFLSVKRKHKKNSHVADRKNFKEAQKKFDHLLRKKKRLYQWGRMLVIDKCSTKDPTAFWNYIKKLGPMKKEKIPWAVEIDGNISTNKETVLRKWECEYSRLYTVRGDLFDDNFKRERLLQNERVSIELVDTGLNNPIELTEIETAIQQLKVNKATGLDMVPNELLKNTVVKDLLLSFFRTCFTEGVVPDIWRKSIIHPIPKTRLPSMDPMDYRGLALQCCISKVISSIINRRVVKHLNENSLLEDEQNGFRKSRSCLHHIHSLMTIVRKNCISGNSNIFGCFVDFCKAFDFTDRELMLHKLKEDGIDGNTHKLISTLYNNTSNLIRINGEYSDAIESHNGVLQGSNLSPTIFCHYINGLIKQLNDSDLGVKIGTNRRVCVLAYADDLVLIAENEGKLLLGWTSFSVFTFCE